MIWVIFEWLMPKTNFFFVFLHLLVTLLLVSPAGTKQSQIEQLPSSKDLPRFTRKTSNFSKMHSGNLSQSALPNMWLLVLNKSVKRNFFSCSYEISNYTSTMFLPKRMRNVFLLYKYYPIKFFYKMVPSIVAEAAFSLYLENDLSYWFWIW